MLGEDVDSDIDEEDVGDDSEWGWEERDGGEVFISFLHSGCSSGGYTATPCVKGYNKGNHSLGYKGDEIALN